MKTAAEMFRELGYEPFEAGLYGDSYGTYIDLTLRHPIRKFNVYGDVYFTAKEILACAKFILETEAVK